MAVIRKTSMPVREMQHLLGLGKTDTYWLIKKNYFDTVQIAGKMRVMINSFEEWYAHQYTYHKVNGEPPGSAYTGILLSVSDIADILGLAYGTAEDLVARNDFEFQYIYGKRRIVKTSFDSWYASQSTYLNKEDRAGMAALEAATMSMPEAARLLGISRDQIYVLVARGHFDMVQIGRQKRMTKESFERWYEGQRHYKKVSVTADDLTGKEKNDGIDS